MKSAKPKISAGEALAAKMADDIRAGIFGQGAWLKQVDLEERYHAKRITVRHALTRLVQERLAQHFPNRGYRVYQIDDRQFREIRQIRTRLELFASETMLDNTTEDVIEKLQVLADRYAKAVTSGTAMEQIQSNRDFHHCLLDLSSNKELVALTIDFRQRTPSALTNRWRTHEQRQQSAQFLYRMVDALRNRDLQALQDAFRAQEALVMEYLASRQ